MSNILSDQHRQTIAMEIIQTVQPACYVDVGCFEGTSMEWWLKCGRVPMAFGVDLDQVALEECVRKNPLANLFCMDSVKWLEDVKILPSPAVFYLDTDWREELRKIQEIETILKRWPQSVIIGNGVNKEGHPLYKMNNRPWDVFEVFEQFKAKGVGQFLHPIYNWPELQQGYVILNGCQKLRFDSALFEDLLTASGRETAKGD